MPSFVHGDNIAQKKGNSSKNKDQESLEFLNEIESKYVEWKQANLALKGDPKEVVSQRVKLLNQYKNFVDQQKYAEKFDSRSNLHSTVLEEFLVHLFATSIPHLDMQPVVGKGETLKSFYLSPRNFADLLGKPEILVETKNHDFIIGTTFEARFQNRKKEDIASRVFQIPAIAIECKTYLDKTMLEGASISAEELKRINPSSRYFIVAEWLKLTESVNLRKYRIDQIYVLRKQRNTDREFRFDESYVKNPIYEDLVENLYDEVLTYLSADRWDIEAGLTRGKLL